MLMLVVRMCFLRLNFIAAIDYEDIFTTKLAVHVYAYPKHREAALVPDTSNRKKEKLLKCLVSKNWVWHIFLRCYTLVIIHVHT